MEFIDKRNYECHHDEYHGINFQNMFKVLLNKI